MVVHNTSKPRRRSLKTPRKGTVANPVDFGNIDPATWIEAGPGEDSRARLMLTVSFGGVFFHLDAIAVVSDEHHVQRPEFDYHDGRVGVMLDRMREALYVERPWYTARIIHREYVVFFTPFQRGGVV